MWVYIESEPGLWTVGFYDPSGQWHGDSDHQDRETAAERVHYLNGGDDDEPPSMAEIIRRDHDARRYRP